MSTSKHPSREAMKAWCQPVKPADVAHLGVRLKTCLHFYVASVPIGTVLSVLLLLGSFYKVSPTDAVRPISVIVAYIAFCGILFCGATYQGLKNLRDLWAVVRWHGGTRTLSLLMNASYPLAFIALILPSLAPPPHAAVLLDTLALHLVLSCCVRDGVGTVLTIASTLEDAA